MFDMLCRFVQFSLLMTPFAAAEVGLDYYFGGSLRTDVLVDCSSKVVKNSCQLKCGPNHACLLGRCFCLQTEDTPLDEGSEEMIEKLTEQDDSFNDFQDYTEITPELRMQSPLTDFEPKPVLRHHIAHFCPNLEVARECIRKCMELGKPAFCGKDHVCYCGHKYSDSLLTDANATTLNPADTYAEFKDLYEKYFGPRVTTSSAYE